jgi:predicted alpha/beta-hydrolase family hydrolase
MAAPEERVRIQTERGDVSGLFASVRGAHTGLVLAHGAGGDMQGPLLSGFARALQERGTATLRFNFLYTERGRRSPDPEPALRAVWVAAFEAMRRRLRGVPVAAGGKSLGGRIASMCVADGEIDASALVFLGYPLHPPGKPDRVRDAHLDRVSVPMLFLHGTSDPFARPGVLGPLLERLGNRATYHPIQGGDHSFRVRGAKRDDREIGAELAIVAAEFLDRIPEPR